MMTNRRWFVERDESEASDILDTPFPIPSEAEIQTAVALFDSDIAYYGEGSRVRIDQFAYDQYKLLPHEIALIEDAINYLYDYYSKKEQSVSLKAPHDNILRKYSLALQQILKNSLGARFPLSCSVYRGDAPLTVSILHFSGQIESQVTLNKTSEELNCLLYKLDEQLLEERSESVFVKRNVRIYEKNCIYIIKPNQARYWNYSSACRDADEIYADVMRVWRGENE